LCFPQGDSVQGCDTSRRNLLEQLVCGKENECGHGMTAYSTACAFRGWAISARVRTSVVARQGRLVFEEDFEGYSPVQVLKRIHVHSLPLGEKVARCFTLFS